MAVIVVGNNIWMYHLVYFKYHNEKLSEAVLKYIFNSVSESVFAFSPEPVLSLVQRDYWQCFEQTPHQDACGR